MFARSVQVRTILGRDEVLCQLPVSHAPLPALACCARACRPARPGDDCRRRHRRGIAARDDRPRRQRPHGTCDGRGALRASRGDATARSGPAPWRGMPVLPRQALRVRAAAGGLAVDSTAAAADCAAPVASDRIGHAGACHRILADVAASDRLNLLPQADLHASAIRRSGVHPDARVRIAAPWRFIT